jgi:hypothetical protein
LPDANPRLTSGISFRAEDRGLRGSTRIFLGSAGCQPAKPVRLGLSAGCRNNLLQIKFRLREILAANLLATIRLAACAAHADSS